ncbi:hypothetical protein [Luteitalea pratensis]|uniref:hypothetical protein n=1 Tax=Luteitalea pratensis TaxID=1855912 RepID=UPI0012FF968F|nr:hypothetical protein [Luteitalea pratensis]
MGAVASLADAGLGLVINTEQTRALAAGSPSAKTMLASFRVSAIVLIAQVYVR